MKKSILIGSIFATFTLVVAGLSSTVCAEPTDSSKAIKEFRRKIEGKMWFPGSIIGFLVLTFLLSYLVFAAFCQYMGERLMEMHPHL